MSFRYRSMEALDEEFIPQAVLALPEREARRLFDIEDGADDLDTFIEAALMMDDVDVIPKHYLGHPPDTFTVYLRCSDETVEQVTRNVFRIVDGLGLPHHAVLWERSRNPGL